LENTVHYRAKGLETADLHKLFIFRCTIQLYSVTQDCNRVYYSPSTFSMALVPVVCFPFIFPSYEVNHNLTNFDLKLKIIWKSDRKAKVKDCP